MHFYGSRRWKWTVAKTMEALGWKTTSAIVGKVLPTAVAGVGGFMTSPSADLGVRTFAALGWVVAGGLITLAFFLAYHWWVSAAQMDAELRQELDALKAAAAAASPDAAAAKVAALEERLNTLHQPYGLTNSEAKRLLEVLRQHDRSAIFISRDNEASDADFFYNQVTDAFRRAGWIVSGGIVYGIDDQPECGVTLYDYEGVPADPKDLIKSALRAAGITFQERISVRPSALTVPQLAFSRRDSRWTPPARYG
jgi:hypothetical protein